MATRHRPVYLTRLHCHLLQPTVSFPLKGKDTSEISLELPNGLKLKFKGASMLAEVLLQKYEYHVPFYRQVKQLEHLGVKLSRNTLDGWFKPAVKLLKPLYGVLRQEIMKFDYIQGDETTVSVLDKAGHQTNKKYLWMVKAVAERLLLFHYDKESRSGTVIGQLAKDFKGYFQCDGFEGYESAFKVNPNVRLVNCMAHIRRYFEQALAENRQMAEHALKEIQLLYLSYV